jgi:hypothetical protein
MTTPEATSPEAMPAWVKTINDNILNVDTRLTDLENELKKINSQLQTIGDVDEFGHPL